MVSAKTGTVMPRIRAKTIKERTKCFFIITSQLRRRPLLVVSNHVFGCDCARGARRASESRDAYSSTLRGKGLTARPTGIQKRRKTPLPSIFRAEVYHKPHGNNLLLIILLFREEAWIRETL